MLSPISVNVNADTNANGNIVNVEAVPYMNISKRDVYALNNIFNHNIHGHFGLIDIRARNISVEPFRHKLIVEIAAMRTSVTVHQLPIDTKKCDGAHLIHIWLLSDPPHTSCLPV
ncbi:hypothetical protein [Photobacterium profundum]|uniref:Uncharacterized protein n=1 Tax=Photobacterium profundum (strain SS9) TaxID=298386 RepID=Q6LI61_PHOPR|nr:hypothetical protein [Photobacterium profundum]CAG23019.1 hypothetical protein PBPRB1147 [Photobacterium profundum SS9]